MHFEYHTYECTYPSLQSGKAVAKVHEKGIFDIAARILVIHSAGRLPPNLDMSLLADETVNFAQDFLVYTRDRRLGLTIDRKEAEQELDVPELLHTGGVMVELWRSIIEPHCSIKVLKLFDEITGWYLAEDKIVAILRKDECIDLLTTLDKALRSVIERF